MDQLEEQNVDSCHQMQFKMLYSIRRIIFWQIALTDPENHNNRKGNSRRDDTRWFAVTELSHSILMLHLKSKSCTRIRSSANYGCPIVHPDLNGCIFNPLPARHVYLTPFCHSHLVAVGFHWFRHSQLDTCFVFSPCLCPWVGHRTLNLIYNGMHSCKTCVKVAIKWS